MGLFSFFRRGKTAGEFDYTPSLTPEQEAALRAKRESGIPEYTQEDITPDPEEDPLGYYKHLTTAQGCKCSTKGRKIGAEE